MPFDPSAEITGHTSHRYQTCPEDRAGPVSCSHSFSIKRSIFSLGISPWLDPWVILTPCYSDADDLDVVSYHYSTQICNQVVVVFFDQVHYMDSRGPVLLEKGSYLHTGPCLFIEFLYFSCGLKIRSQGSWNDQTSTSTKTYRIQRSCTMGHSKSIELHHDSSLLMLMHMPKK